MAQDDRIETRLSINGLEYCGPSNPPYPPPRDPLPEFPKSLPYHSTMAATPPHKSEVGNFNPSLPCNQDPTLLVALSRKERIQERISIYCPVVLAILALVTVVVVGVLAGERLLPYQQKNYLDTPPNTSTTTTSITLFTIPSRIPSQPPTTSSTTTLSTPTSQPPPSPPPPPSSPSPPVPSRIPEECPKSHGITIAESGAHFRIQCGLRYSTETGGELEVKTFAESMRGCVWMCLQTIDAASAGRRKVAGVNFAQGDGSCYCYTKIGKPVASEMHGSAFRVAD